MEKPEMKKEGKDVTFSMLLDAPRDFVWDMMYSMEFIPAEYVPGLKTKSFEIDLRVGGKMKSVTVDQEGNEYTEISRITELEPKDRVKWKSETSMTPELNVETEEMFEDRMGKTKYTVIVHFDSEENASKVGDMGWDDLFMNSLEEFRNFVMRKMEEEKVTK